MNQPNQPGKGAIFFRKLAADAWTEKASPRARKTVAKEGVVAMYTGEMTLPGNQRVQVKANFVEKRGVYEFTVGEFDTWNTLSTFEAPAFEGQPYVDTVMKIGTRPYKLRLIDASKTDPDTGEVFKYIRLNLPQVGGLSRNY